MATNAEIEVSNLTANPFIRPSDLNMPNYPENYKIQFASVGLEFDSMQLNPITRKYDWQLKGNVTFNSFEISGTTIGDIEVFINKATLTIELENCEFDPMILGYQRMMEQKRDITHEITAQNSTDTESSIGATAAASTSLKAQTGSLGIAGGRNASAKKSTSSMEHGLWEKSQHLVTHTATGMDKKSADWKIGSIDGSKLIGTVINRDDSEQGNLGTFSSNSDGGFSVKPNIQIMSSAQLIDESNLTRTQKIRLSINRGDRNKLGVIGALLKKKVIHTEFDKIEQKEFK